MQKRFESVANPATGQAIAGASVQVNVAGGAIATIYSDDGVTTRANPIITDANGYFEYFAADGLYDWVISGAGLTTRTIEDVLHEDPTDPHAGAFSSIVVADSISLGGVQADEVSALGALVLLQNRSGVGLTDLDFTVGIGALYDSYVLKMSDVALTSGSGSISLKVSQDGGSSFISAPVPYAYRSEDYDGSSTSVSGTATSSSIPVLENLGTTQTCQGEITFSAPSNTARSKLFESKAVKMVSSGVVRYSSWGVFKLNTAAIDAIRLTASSVIVAGNFALYGYRKA